MSANQQVSGNPRQDTTATDASAACGNTIDRTAPAGASSSLGAKSDCNGRPATDDSVVEAIDEQGPVPSSRQPGRGDDRS